jgi:hypothetical protein
MATAYYFLSSDPALCRRCARCGEVLRLTSQIELACPRCGRVRVWTINLHDLEGTLADLRLTVARDSVGSSGGRNEDD